MADSHIVLEGELSTSRFPLDLDPASPGPVVRVSLKLRNEVSCFLKHTCLKDRLLKNVSATILFTPTVPLLERHLHVCEQTRSQRHMLCHGKNPEAAPASIAAEWFNKLCNMYMTKCSAAIKKIKRKLYLPDRNGTVGCGSRQHIAK